LNFQCLSSGGFGLACETLLLDVPHRQIVFTIPKRLRVFFKFNRRLLGDLYRCALRSLSCYEAVTGSALTPGIIAAIQTFGDRINLHMHLHFLVTEGGVDEAAVSPVLMNRKRFMSAGVFQKIPRIDDSRLAEVFAREVLGFLVQTGSSGAVLRLLTVPPGRRYSSAVVRRVNSAPRTGIQLARKKQILIFLSLPSPEIITAPNSQVKARITGRRPFWMSFGHERRKPSEIVQNSAPGQHGIFREVTYNRPRL